jgi:hypothetical protein
MKKSLSYWIESSAFCIDVDQRAATGLQRRQVRALTNSLTKYNLLASPAPGVLFEMFFDIIPQ